MHIRLRNKLSRPQKKNKLSLCTNHVIAIVLYVIFCLIRKISYTHFKNDVYMSITASSDVLIVVVERISYTKKILNMLCCLIHPTNGLNWLLTSSDVKQLKVNSWVCVSVFFTLQALFIT
jgi:hypothetical protein